MTEQLNEVMPNKNLNEPAPEKDKGEEKRECLNEPAPEREKISENGEDRVQLNG